jgi:SAM-dependent methyltransferase
MAFEQQPEALRNQVKNLAEKFIEKTDPTGWFDVLYQDADGDHTKIPWAKMTANPILVDWLENYQPNSQGKTALVIGCALGDDAEFLANYGYQVTAFDISPTAINWCQQRFSHSKVIYLRGDLLAENPQWENKFDLVFESRNIQALPLNIRTKVIKNIAKFVKNQGKLLVINRLQDSETEPDGPPWPLSENELNHFKKLGFHEVNRTLFAENFIINARLEYQLK